MRPLRQWPRHRFDHRAIETKWQLRWEADRLYEPEAGTHASGPKHYALVMFPYTSGDLHLGHWWNFALADVHVRHKRMQGFNVLFPPGFDAFGPELAGLDPATGECVQEREQVAAFVFVPGGQPDFERLPVAIDG